MRKETVERIKNSKVYRAVVERNKYNKNREKELVKLIESCEDEKRKEELQEELERTMFAQEAARRMLLTSWFNVDRYEILNEEEQKDFLNALGIQSIFDIMIELSPEELKDILEAESLDFIYEE